MKGFPFPNFCLISSYSSWAISPLVSLSCSLLSNCLSNGGSATEVITRIDAGGRIRTVSIRF